MARVMYYDVILKPVVTEKSMRLMAEGKYTFLVHPEANKQMIKDMKLRLIYHSNKNIEALNDTTNEKVKELKKQIKEGKGDASKLNAEISRLKKECAEKSAKLWEDQKADALRAKERYSAK